MTGAVADHPEVMRMAEKGTAKESARRSATRGEAGFTDEERAAMRERSKELKAAASRSRGAGRGNGESDLLAKIAEMPPKDRAMATRLHALIKATAPTLEPRTWYGMPAYSLDGDVVCFFQGAAKFKSRYATLGFSDKAALDKGAMWPTSFALERLGDDEEKKIRSLIKKAVG